MVLNWSWLRTVCSSRCPGGTSSTVSGLTANRALPVGVAELAAVARRVREREAARRSSRALKSSNPGTTRAMWSRITP